MQFHQHPQDDPHHHSSEESILPDQPKSSQDNAKYNSDSDDINKNFKTDSPGIDDGQVNTFSVGPDVFYYFTSIKSQKSIFGQQLDFTLFTGILKTIADKEQGRLDVYKIAKLNNLVLPLRAQLSVEITVFNPFPKTLKVIEVFGGGPSFQLALPSGKVNDHKSVWKIMPYQTKPIIKFVFSGHTKNIYTTNVGILLSNQHYLNIPISISILPKPGLYYSELVIDFGFIFKNRMLSTRALKLCNSAKSSNTVKNITSDAHFVTVSFTNEVEVPPQSCTTGHVALITHYWDYERYLSGQTYGQLTVKSLKGSELHVPYNAMLLLGNLTYQENSLHFVIPEDNSKDSSSFFKTFTITNNFSSVSVAISEVILQKNATQHFMIKGFNPVILKPDQSVQLFRIVCLDVRTFKTQLVSSLELKTNASDFTIPLMAYKGLLLDIVPGNFIIQFPTETIIPCHTYVVVANINPVPLNLEDWGTTYTPYTTLTLVEIEEYNNSSKHNKVNEWSRPLIKQNLAMPPVTLPAKHYAIFQLMVHQEANQKPKVAVDVWIQTLYQRHNKLLMLPEFKQEFLVMDEPLGFKNCHPGTVCTVDVIVKSWINKTVEFNSVTDDVLEEKIAFVFSPSTTIGPQAVSLLGKLRWVPVTRKSSESYIGLNTKEKAMWLLSVQLTNLFEASNMDFSWFYRRLEKYYARIHNQNFKHHFLLESTKKNKCQFTAIFNLKWPKFVQNELTTEKTKDSLHQTTFEILTAEVNGAPQYQKIVVKNTFKSRNLTMQFAMYTKPYKCKITDIIKLHEHEVHSLNVSRDDWELMLTNTSPYRKKVSNIRDTKFAVHNQTMFFVLPPQEQLEVSVRFWPNKPGDSAAVLFIRNDASILESVLLKGKGVHPALKLRSYDEPTKVIFDLGSKSIIKSFCNKQNLVSFNQTETKDLELINPYNRFVIVSAMKINGVPCGVEGIRILNCNKLVLFRSQLKRCLLSCTLILR
ncbi:transmembrane protein 131-like isoform X2 [Adelges cooleyi]|nr:transmembrane protein 131-like isoform X2 [Adelges cooleyi]XP_050438017.1 transmembrane protein 131-like isoform X2 [Adelges cooleyi]XP_050438018.1 transmembrane protein 131-like isoform X2 [Adelges cooleyi]XP_050438019.1 transmembrane protein 131-like isoform X2 [Adelges cooleyi]